MLQCLWPTLLNPNVRRAQLPSTAVWLYSLAKTVYAVDGVISTPTTLAPLAGLRKHQNLHVVMR